ncbi:heat-inducible transcription repressor HrcA [Iodidimonas muriae]|uniref:Heat-inducible transcription repressor HrcA n=1 Tax=Iodidimonas muriae TaxID=261467 RepID=A0ABQ2LAG7_9PROT|nr:heat-inducible transcriptional repressor HrcA [Iodidimonas muriae]GER05932.1 heat-inducible transcription repressor HrcA [Kordiimonadales bacterium JCM 17843]GGO07478.1 heat-inducible transcription repressor HrcA [Iodidimonas muriae]
MQIGRLNDRSRAIFRTIVESYLDTGDPVGSRTISRQPGIDLSAASIRNVMADLEETGLIYSPHTSAGRVPTELGLRLFVDGLLEIGNLTDEERANIDVQCAGQGRRREDVLADASNLLSGLSHCASLVMAPKTESPVRHVEFVPLPPDRALVVVVSEDGAVENRVITLPKGLPPIALVQAGNYLSNRFKGRTFEEARLVIERELAQQQAELDALTSKVVEEGLATWTGDGNSSLIVRGRGNLLENVRALEDLERIRKLFDELETKQELTRLLESARDAEGVKIFIGSENNLFSLSGSSLVVSPYMKGDNKIVGVIGVIGPTRINYARIIPMVDYTAKVIGRLL